MFTTPQSMHSNKCAKIFSSNFGWSCAYPMKTKEGAHDALFLVFQHEGVPPLMVIDGSKELTLGRFCQKLCNASCKQKTTEPYLPWQNVTEMEIKKLKKGAVQMSLVTNMPHRLWDDCLEYKAYVRSLMAHDIFKLDGEVPKNVMSGETVDISQFCELGCYDWVKFCSTTVSFPEDLLVLGKYLGLSIDICPTMTAKILTPTGEVIHCSMYTPHA